MTQRRVSRIAAPFAAMLLLSGCATVGQDRLAEKDPLEKINRAMWDVDMAADKVLLRPVAQAYRAVTPSPLRRGVANFFTNLAEPWSAINNVLQGKPKRAARNIGRFVVNSTVGVAGLMDNASKMGIKPAAEDFGQTLAVWGFNAGPYLVLPIFGPSTMRDGIGQAASAWADPVGLAINNADINVWWKRGRVALSVINVRSELIESGGDAFLESSLDPYAAAKSAFLQQRRAAIVDAEGDAGPADDFAPAGEDVPTPVGDAAALPPAGGALPESGAPLPGDAPAAAPSQPSQPLPQSGAPLPGDAPAAPPASAAPLPESAAPMPGDPPAATPKS